MDWCNQPSEGTRRTHKRHNHCEDFKVQGCPLVKRRPLITKIMRLTEVVRTTTHLPPRVIYYPPQSLTVPPSQIFTDQRETRMSSLRPCPTYAPSHSQNGAPPSGHNQGQHGAPRPPPGNFYGPPPMLNQAPPIQNCAPPSEKQHAPPSIQNGAPPFHPACAPSQIIVAAQNQTQLPVLTSLPDPTEKLMVRCLELLQTVPPSGQNRGAPSLGVYAPPPTRNGTPLNAPPQEHNQGSPSRPPPGNVSLPPSNQVCAPPQATPSQNSEEFMKRCLELLLPLQTLPKSFAKLDVFSRLFNKSQKSYERLSEKHPKINCSHLSSVAREIQQNIAAFSILNSQMLEYSKNIQKILESPEFVEFGKDDEIVTSNITC